MKANAISNEATVESTEPPIEKYTLKRRRCLTTGVVGGGTAGSDERSKADAPRELALNGIASPYFISGARSSSLPLERCAPSYSLIASVSERQLGKPWRATIPVKTANAAPDSEPTR